MSGSDYRPVKFLDQLEGNRHLVLLYDDEKSADLVIARYFLNGFAMGGSCVFFTDGDPKVIENRLSAQGLDVDRLRRENRLRILQTGARDTSATSVLKTLRTMTAEFTKGMRPPFRFAGRTIPDIESVEGLLSGMRVEKTGQKNFEEFNVSLLCPYDVRKLERSRRDEWVRRLLESHDQVIYASDPDKAVGFDTSLLEEEE